MQTEEKVQFMTNEESYTQRRMLFKDIWETAMNIEEKDDIMNKPKVIKTLRLDEVDKCVVGKTKKQRIKNLRHVCNRILDFCDKQDADDVFYEQLAAEGQEPFKAIQKIDIKHPKKKTHRNKKKINKAKSIFVPRKVVKHINTTVSEQKTAKVKALKIPLTVPEKETTVIKSKAKVVKPKGSPMKEAQASPPVDANIAFNDSSDSQPSETRRKPVKKQRSKRKKPSDSAVQAIDMMKIKTGRMPRASPKPTDLSKPLPQLPRIMIN